MTTPQFTIIMPCYNAAATLAEAVNSVLAQSLPDFELLIIDDGSTDGSAALACSLASEDRRIRVICQLNSGPAEARNRGLMEAAGEYMAFLDADDRWVPELLALHRAHFMRNQHCGVSFGRVRFYDPTLRQAGRASAAMARLSLADVLGEYPVCTTSNLACRRDVYEEAGGFAPALTHGEDQEWVARVLALTDWEVCGLPEILVHYRTSPAGLSADLEKMRAGWLGMMSRVRGYAPVETAHAAAQAEALFLRYLARRALRTGQPRASLAPLLRAWRASPRALLRCAPRRTLLTTMGVVLAMLPGNFARDLLTR